MSAKSNSLVDDYAIMNRYLISDIRPSAI